MDEYDDWCFNLDTRSLKNTVSMSERNIIKRLKNEISSFSDKAWNEVFDIIKNEYKTRNGE
jgi:hypothetical protein